MTRTGWVLVGLVMSACSDSAIGPTRPSQTTVRYACAARDRMVAAFLATKPTLPIVTTLPSGELVYIDWLERVFHHSGPTCE